MAWQGRRYFPEDEPRSILDLEPEEVAFLVLRYLNDVTKGKVGQGRHDLTPHNLFNSFHTSWRTKLGDDFDKVVNAYVEAWNWLERHGLIAARYEADRY